MRNEAAFKKHFKASVRAQGGFSISLAAPMLPGIPDLYVVMPGYVPVLLEAKLLKNLSDRFNITPRFTEMQKNFINNCNKVLPGSAFGLICMKYQGCIHATLTDPNLKFSYLQISTPCKNASVITHKSEYFDVRAMFEGVVPKLELTYTPTCGSVAADIQIGEVELRKQLTTENVNETKDALA